MDTVANDPELASNLLSLLNKELKAARLRIQELQDHGLHDEKDASRHIERAEKAEKELEMMKEDYRNLSTENGLLRKALQELRDSKAFTVKQEHGEEDASLRELSYKSLSRQPSLPVIAHLESESANEMQIKDLEIALERYYAKYKKEKQEKKSLQEYSKTLEDQVAHLQKEREEKENFEKSCSSLRRQAAEIQTEIKELQRKRESALDSLVRDQFTFTISYANIVSKCSANFLYLPGLIQWCANVQHAVAVGPFRMFDTKNGLWNRESIFGALYDKSFPLFYKSGFSTYYAGTYKAIKLVGRLPLDGFGDYTIFDDNLSLFALADASVSRNSASKGTNHQPPTNSAIQALYRDGLLKVELLGLQCVGFDQKLYNALQTRNASIRPLGLSHAVHYPETNKKRQNTRQEPPKKKQKRE
ncbi:hypothetical protein CVT26_005266 [Gymnopilus dilepis]|uniref:DUF6697 domain-containing protein n=1 Tax=Gymnopilus dilepis TaxID=231916 RepID=A0A409YVK5_9AGAR|nr:hypothetical protein CVT26_005266 [Gymnopilus dilepis]